METKTENLDRLYGELVIEQSKLERFENRTPERDYNIDFTCPEFTCLCPKSGFPDFATIYISYVPDQWCVELKSLKLYINQFRNEKVFHEDVTNRILDDLVGLLEPRWMEVKADFNVRGNIHTLITAEHHKKKPEEISDSKCDIILTGSQGPGDHYYFIICTKSVAPVLEKSSIAVACS